MYVNVQHKFDFGNGQGCWLLLLGKKKASLARRPSSIYLSCRLPPVPPPIPAATQDERITRPVYGIKGKKENICTILNYDDLSTEHKSYYNDAESRLTRLYDDVINGKVQVNCWNQTNIDYDYYAIEFDWPIPNPSFSLSVLMNKLKTVFCDCIDIDGNYATLFALWVAHSYITETINISPLLIIKCDDDNYDAKVAILTLIMTLTKSPFRASAVNSRVFLDDFKYLDHTILFDDPSIFKNKEMQYLVTNARTRSDAIKIIKGKNGLDSFKTFGPKVIASDGELPKSIMNSGIMINLDHPRICNRPHRITEADRNAHEAIRDGLECFRVGMCHGFGPFRVDYCLIDNIILSYCYLFVNI